MEDVQAMITGSPTRRNAKTDANPKQNQKVGR